METDLLILVVTLTTRQGSVIMMTRKRWLRARCDRDGFPIGRFEPRRKRSSVCPNKDECVPLESDDCFFFLILKITLDFYKLNVTNCLMSYLTSMAIPNPIGFWDRQQHASMHIYPLLLPRLLPNF
uniref:Uncharacterized protein n=1 Tax=Cacopsylla melanoneura TaxID=428564 RepID=A0A8D8XI65_9HEMI